jgi:transcriptional regulator with XRE-family HTH domain
VRGRRLASELRRLRERSRLTGDEVAQRLGWSGSKVSRIELHRTGVKPADLLKLLDLYQVGEPHRGELLALARESSEKWRPEIFTENLTEEISRLIVEEAEAKLMLNWEPQIVPGLLQTADYARAVISGVQSIFGLPPGDIESRVKARLARQHVLERDDPLTLSVVMDESVLHRKYGSRATMNAQLMHLAQASWLPNVSVRILPLAGEHPIGTGSFTYMQFAQVHDVPLPDAVILEHLVNNYRIEDEESTYKYRTTFEHLAGKASSPARSRDIITHTAARLWS